MAVVRPVNENRQELRPIPGNRLRAAEFDSGQAINRAVTQLGGAGMDYVEERNEEAIEQARIVARDADNAATAERQALYYEGENAFFNLQGRNALNAAPALRQERERIDREALERLQGDPIAQGIYRRAAAARRLTDNQRISQHVATQRTAYENNVDDDALRVAVDAAANAYGDPAEILRNIETARSIAQRSALRNGLAADGSPEMEIRQRRAAGLVVTSVANRIERRSPAEARAFIQTMEDRIDADTFTRLLDAVEESAATEEADENVVEDLVYVGGTEAPAEGETPPATPGNSPPRLSAPAGDTSRVMNYVARGRGFQSVPANVRTLGEASDFALRVNRAGASSSAMGTYQITGETLRDFAPRVFGANWRSQPFTPAAQERLAEAIFNSARGSAAALSGRWASLTLAEAERVRHMPWSQARVEIARGESGGSVRGPGRERQSVVDGPEIDLVATTERINARTDLTYAERQARIAAATRRHGAERQARAEAEDAVKDQAYAEMNRLGENFTNYNQLPLAVRSRISRFPQLEAQLRGAADENRRQREAEANGEERHSEQYLDLLELANSPNPEERAAFLRQDIRTAPGLAYNQRVALINRQGELNRRDDNAEQRASQTSAAQIRRRITAIAGEMPDIGTGRQRTVTQRRNQVLLEERVRLRVLELQRSRGRGGVTDDEVDDIIASEVQEVQVVTRGRVWGQSSTPVPAYRAEEEARGNSRYAGTRYTLPPGVPERDGQQIIAAYRRAHGNRSVYPTPEEILRIYQERRGR